MLEVANPIKEGSEGFCITQYGTIFKLAFIFSGAILLIYLFRSPSSNSIIQDHMSSVLMSIFVAVSFLIGAFCSALSGYAGMWVSVRANVRVAAASRKCYDSAIKICFRGGAFAAIINVALALFGISSLYLALYF
jgi:Na+/H+-translocating membrane pyrophosphatase